MRRTNDAAAFGFGGGKPVANRTLRKFRARRRVMPGFPWEGQFQTKEEVDRYFAGDRIICLLCGKSYRKVAIHCTKIHGVDEDAYRRRFGLPMSRGLVSDASREAYAEHVSTPEQSVFLAQMRSQIRRRGGGRSPLVYYRPTDNLARIDGFKVWDEEATHAEFLRRIGEGRTKRDVCRDADMPKESWIHVQFHAHPKFRAAFDAVWEGLPFSLQARSEALGKRFETALRALFDQGMSDHEAARILGVTAMACNRRTKLWRMSR